MLPLESSARAIGVNNNVEDGMLDILDVACLSKTDIWVSSINIVTLLGSSKTATVSIVVSLENASYRKTMCMHARTG